MAKKLYNPKLVHASISENGNAGWDGRAKRGDQTGKEVFVRSFYSKPWNVMLRYKNPDIAEKATQIALKLAKSNLVGYDQSERNNLYSALKRHNFDVDSYIASGEKTETDCSAFVYAVYACLIPSMRSNSNAPVTSNMRDFFTEYGFHASSDGKYLLGNDMMEGDILLKEGSHVALCTEGVIISMEKTSVDMPVLEKGMSGVDAIYTVQALLKYNEGIDIGKYGIDGDFGSDTEKAVRTFQSKNGLSVDGVVGHDTYRKLLGGL